MTEWYRTPGWTLADQEDFERRLRRAKPWNRGDYLRIKGLALWEEGLVGVARTLWIRALTETRDSFTQMPALEHLADSLRDEDPDVAEVFYRRMLAQDPTLNGTSTMAEVHCAELLIRRGDVASLEEARTLLDAWTERDPLFPAERFAGAVVEARWHDATGRPEAAGRWAADALELAELESPLASAPGLAVRGIEPALETWLREVARRRFPA